jgi:hypothetical protein
VRGIVGEGVADDISLGCGGLASACMPKQATTIPAGQNRILEKRIIPRSLKSRLDLQPASGKRHCVDVIYIPGRCPSQGDANAHP